MIDNPVQKAIEADDAWQAEINRALPGVVNARYLPIGRGEPGTELRRLYELRKQAQAEANAYWLSRHVA